MPTFNSSADYILMSIFWNKVRQLVLNKGIDKSYDIDADLALDQIPPDIEKAQLHANSRKIGIPIIQGGNCACCGFPLKNVPYDVCCENEKYQILGSGFMLFFLFILGCAGLIFVTILGFGLPSLITNSMGDFCQDETLIENDCVSFMLQGKDENRTLQFIHDNFPTLLKSCLLIYFKPDEISDCSQILCGGQTSLSDQPLCLINKRPYQVLSLINKRDNVIHRQWQTRSNNITVVLSLVVLHFMRRYLRDIENQVDFRNKSPSDYTVILQNVPIDAGEAKLQQEVQNWCDKKNIQDQTTLHKINQIIHAYDIKKYLEKLRTKQSIIQEKKRMSVLSRRNMVSALSNIYFNQDGKNKSQEQLDKDLMIIQFELCEIENQVYFKEYKHYTSVAFVKFEYEKTQRDFVQSFSYNYKKKIALFVREKLFGEQLQCQTRQKWGFLVEGQRVSVRRAPEPTDIVWSNCKAHKNALRKRIIINILGILFFGLIFAFSLFYEYLTNPQNITLSILSGVIVVIVNIILILLIKKLVQMEELPTITYYNISVGSKLIFAQLLNTGVLTLLVNYYLQKKKITNDMANKHAQLMENWQGGNADNIFWVMLSNAILPPILSLFNPFYFHRLIMRRIIQKQGKNCLYTQRQANYWFEGNSCDVYAKYAHIIKSMLLSAFFSSLVPIILIFTFVGLFLNYWVEKYLIARRYARSSQLGSELNEFMQAYLQLYPLMLCLGSLFFDVILLPPENNSQVVQNSEGQIITIVLIPICILNFLFGKLANKRFFAWWDAKHGVEHPIEFTEPHSETQAQFISDYDRTNPITLNIAMRKWIQSNKENKQFDNEETRRIAMIQMASTVYQLNLDLKTFEDVAKLAKQTLQRIKKQKQELEEVIKPIRKVRFSIYR